MMLRKRKQRPILKYFLGAVFIVAAVALYKNPRISTQNKNIDEANYATGQESYKTQQQNIAHRLELQGKLDEAISIYRKLLYPDKDVAKTHIHLGIAYNKKKQYDDALRHLRNALEIDPSLLSPHLYMGKILANKNLHKEAVETYQKILAVRPDNVDTHLYIARSFMELGDHKKALVHNQIALKLAPDNVHAYLNTGHAYNKLGKMDEAIAMYQKATAIAPDLANAYHNLGYTLRIRGKLDEALAALNKAIELDPDYVDPHIARAQTYWGLKDFKHGLPEYEWRWRLFGRNHNDTVKQMWDGSDLQGKRILLYSEQGLGDTVQFIRYAKLLKKRGATVICKVQKPLVQLLSACPFIDKVVSQANTREYDTHAALLSLPRILKTTPDTIPTEIPYLHAPPQLVDLWQKKLSNDKNFKIGLCWHVAPEHERIKCPSAFRSVNLEAFKPLADLEGVSFYSLQKINGVDQLSNKPEKLVLNTFGPDFDDSNGRFMDTAAVIENLDLILTVDTSVAHVAGALGKPVWMLLPFSPDCRWYLGQNDTPWYPAVRLFRQETPGDFDTVLQHVATALTEKLKQNIEA